MPVETLQKYICSRPHNPSQRQSFVSLGEPILKWNQMNEEGVELLLYGLILGVHDWALTHQVWGLEFTWETNGRCLWHSCWRRANSITILAFQACFDNFDYDYKFQHLSFTLENQWQACFIFKDSYIFTLCVWVFWLQYIYMCTMETRRRLNSLERELDVCKMSYGYQILNLSFPQEQQKLLTTNQPLQQ